VLLFCGGGHGGYASTSGDNSTPFEIPVVGFQADRVHSFDSFSTSYRFAPAWKVVDKYRVGRSSQSTELRGRKRVVRVARLVRWWSSERQPGPGGISRAPLQ